MRCTTAFLILLGVSFGPMAAAAQRPYARLNLGLGLAQTVLGADGTAMSIGADGSIERHPGEASSRSGPGFHLGAAVGYAWGRARLEGEYFRRSTAQASGVHATFANVLYELPVAGPLRTFVGAGAGVQWSGPGVVLHSAPSSGLASGKLDAFTDYDPAAGREANGGRFVPGYQLVGGLERALSESVSFGARVRWAQFGDRAVPESRGLGVTLTLRYGF